jgi:secreted trypsin-like serine protease
MSPEECKSQPFFFGMQNQPNDTFCGAWFGGFEQIFGGGDDEIVSTICKGDSGGALVIPSTIVDPFGFQGDVQIGIVSAGPACPYTPFNESLVWPAEYVDVSQYVPWIHDEMKARGYTPLQVATNPLGRAYKNQTCFPGNCYAENVMANVLASSAAGMVDVKMASLVGILAAFAVF